ncbi:lipopolysaccharide assembly protein LapA domain-containing protein [Hydrogenivirga sp.]
MIVLKVVLFVVLLIVALLFAYFNLQSVKLSFPGFSYEMPLFLVVFASFIFGFILAYLLSEVKGFEWRRYGERLRKGLESFWTGYPDRARGELSKLLDHEETVPMYSRALEELGREASVYLQKYAKGIVETSIAERVFREDMERAKDLLEKALGKNWKNLRARRLLRSIYFLEGEGEKALDLQRKLVQDSERALRDVERRVLASLLAEVKGAEAVAELEKLPLTPSSLSVLLSVSEPRDRKKYAQKVFQEGLHDETLLAVLDKNSLTPELMKEVEENRDVVNPAVLAMLYLSVGMYEKLEQLKDSLPMPIRFVIEKGYGEDRECYRELLSLVRLVECGECGKEYHGYASLCRNCLTWNKLKTKGGR